MRGQGTDGKDSIMLGQNLVAGLQQHQSHKLSEIPKPKLLLLCYYLFQYLLFKLHNIPKNSR